MYILLTEKNVAEEPWINHTPSSLNLTGAHNTNICNCILKSKSGGTNMTAFDATAQILEIVAFIWKNSINLLQSSLRGLSTNVKYAAKIDIHTHTRSGNDFFSTN